MTTSKHLKPKKETSTSAPSGSLAKTSVWQVEGKELEKEPDQGCFTSAYGYLGKFDLSSPSLKTLEIYSPLKKGGYSKKSSFKLPKQGMMLNGQLFQQEMWEAATLENVCGSLPTPNTMDHLPPRGLDSMIKQTQVHRKGRTKLANLREAVNPQAVKLFNELQQLRLPTPTSRDWKDSGENMNYKKAAEKKRLAGVLNHTHSDLTGDNMTLNPAFCEEMMGFPQGWTQIGETEKKE